MAFRTIQIDERPGGVGIIILSRPEKRNAISIEMRRELCDCLGNWRDRGSIGAVVLTGAGAVFSAGFDLSEFKKPALFGELYETSAKYHRDIWYFPKPIIAAVNGPALAGGFDLAKLCDLRICSQTASFGHPEIKFGVPPLMTPLRWIVGEGLARDICMTGRIVKSDEAHRIGLVSGIFPEGTLLDRALQIALEILEAPRPALGFLKRNMLDHASRGFEDSFCIEHDKAFQEFLLKKASEFIAGGGASGG
ncbi:MAG: enoyl-CoA hydratase/isomerase family protein [Syntrophales bacterium]